MRRFKISNKKNSKWYWVCVHDSLEELRKHASKYKRGDDFDDCEALCQPTRRIAIEPGKPEREYDNIGTIRILKDAGSMITAHEVLHAALDCYRSINGAADLGEQCSDKEEELCDIFGEFYRQLVIKMYDKGFWK